MNIRVNTNCFKNVLGTIFLLFAVFFVCSTLISVRTVLADPIAPVNEYVMQQSSSRASPRSSSRASGRVAQTNNNRATVARTGTNQKVVNRNVATRSAVNNSRGTTSRSVNARSGKATTTSRSVTSRAGGATRTTSRNVRSRNAISKEVARVGVSGSATTAVRGTSTTYSYLTNRLYTGNYSNIIDSTTGLISADAYSSCLEAYYTCMDEICTARSDTKGRCSCAGRAHNFLEAEKALQTANEELIVLSGQLSLLISTKGKGKDLSTAFTLTEAEEIMNCVSYKDAKAVAGTTKDEEGNIVSKTTYMTNWCQAHMLYDSAECSESVEPSYCTKNSYGFNINNVNGSSSDILAQFKAWANAQDLAKQYTTNKSDSYVGAVTSDIVEIVNTTITTGSTANADLDALAKKWGYKLFEYAHNNVCGRVLDSCFNGIYEACGTPPSVTDSDNKSYNSYISVTSDTGDIKLNERGTGSATTSSSASCFGYTTTTSTTTRTTTTTDPYSSLRGPVADARRSIMQKYLLDANAACDVYGEALQETAQNINYQKIAAKQSLQAKRLEFVQEENEERLATATTAIDNFNECISEIWDCYENYEDEEGWTNARIKAYCSQASQVPACYETMICSPADTQFTAVLDFPDSDKCAFTDEYESSSCRNIVTISEILYGTGVDTAALSTLINEIKEKGSIQIDKVTTMTPVPVGTHNSKAIRENCLQRALSCETPNAGCLRDWKKAGTIGCPAGKYLKAGTTTCISCKDAGLSDDTYCPGAVCNTNADVDCGIQQCQQGYSSSEDWSYCTKDVECREGWYLPAGGSSCSICPQGSYCPGQQQSKYKTGTITDQGIFSCPNGKTTETTGASSVDECTKFIKTCPAGQYIKNNTCVTCEKGSYCEGGLLNHDSNEIVGITQCPNGQTTETTGAKSVQECKIETECLAGQYVKNNRCVSCEKDSYCEGGLLYHNNNEIVGITQCPTGKMTETTGAKSKNECKFTTECSAGQYVKNNICVICEQDSYCEGGLLYHDNNETVGITSCASGKTTDGKGKSSPSDCR
ncbi:MAG: hypothetical protein MJ158_01065 [Alphaproteobacteria bacterium]|nr:hypothetical protein [Alphaproteobacteria bacterium]